jgi:4-amino-4-deoxy-L-arabinose transferase-like glycosyltransferase
LKPTPTTVSDRTRRGTDTLALIAFCGFLFFLGIQLVGLVGADEPRYAQVAREMLARHDWVTPVLNGKPWLEKPPLYYWLAMLAYKGIGVGDTAARLPSAYVSCLFIIFIYVWSRRFRPGMQLDAALITASAAMVVGFGRSASTDMPLTIMFTIAMLCWYGWYAGAPTQQIQKPKSPGNLARQRRWLLGFYLFLALGTLAKGPVAVGLAATIIVAFAVLRRDAKLLLGTIQPIGLALYVAVAAPWYIAVQRANPEFFRTFFLQQNLERFTSNIYHHPQPFWFYLPVALIALLPWTIFAIEAIVDAIRNWRYSTGKPAGEEDFRTYLVLWFLLPVIFFTFSHSKLPGYILPSIPAATILLADFILRREKLDAKPALWIVGLHALLCAAMLSAAFIVPFKLLKLPLPAKVIAVAASLAVATILMLVLTLHSQGYRVLRFATLVPVVIAVALTLRGTAPMINLLLSERPVETTLEETEIGRIPDIAVYDVSPAVEYGLAFYRNHPVASYERNEIPTGDHIVIAAAGTQKELQYRMTNRKVVKFGAFPLQHLDFYFVSRPGGS